MDKSFISLVYKELLQIDYTMYSENATCTGQLPQTHKVECISETHPQKLSLKTETELRGSLTTRILCRLQW